MVTYHKPVHLHAVQPEDEQTIGRTDSSCIRLGRRSRTAGNQSQLGAQTTCSTKCTGDCRRGVRLREDLYGDRLRQIWKDGKQTANRRQTDGKQTANRQTSIQIWASGMLSAFSRNSLGNEQSPHACDPTAGGRDGMETSCKVHSLYPSVVHGGLAPGTARSTSADDRPDIRERFRGLARDRSEGEGKERPGPPDQSSAKPHMAWPVLVKHTQRALGLARVVGKSSRCPGDDCSPRGLARGKDSEAVTATKGALSQVRNGASSPHRPWL